MKNLLLSIKLFSFLIVASLLFVGCSNHAPVATSSANQNTFPSSDLPGETSAAPNTTSQSNANSDLSQLDLPPDFPIYPGAQNFSGEPGFMLDYTVNADVRTASEFYDQQMKANGWTGFSTGGVSAGECGGDCGAVPTKTPGPGPTATPEGWMKSNDQVWRKDNKTISINFSLNSNGSTEILVIFIGQ